MLLITNKLHLLLHKFYNIWKLRQTNEAIVQENMIYLFIYSIMEILHHFTVCLSTTLTLFLLSLSSCFMVSQFLVAFKVHSSVCFPLTLNFSPDFEELRNQEGKQSNSTKRRNGIKLTTERKAPIRHLERRYF